MEKEESSVGKAFYIYRAVRLIYVRVKMEEVYYVFVKIYRNKHKSKLVRNFGLLIIIHESMFSDCSLSTLGVGNHGQRVRDMRLLCI